MTVLRKEAKTGLKGTDYTEIFEILGRGALRSIRWEDKDAPLAQTDALRVTIDGDVIFDAGKDVESAEELDLLGCMLQNAIVVTTDATIRSLQRIPFHHKLKVEYKRAAAGTNGLDITTLFEIKGR